MTAPRVYFAGPWVFRLDRAAHADYLCRLAAEAGLEGVVPFDPAQSPERPALMRPHLIFARNFSRLFAADAVVADITPFRGPHMDPGVAGEIVYAYTKGKPSFAYTANPHPLASRIGAEAGPDLRPRDAHGDAIEDFGLADNCQIVCALNGVFFSAHEALAACARHFSRAPE